MSRSRWPQPGESDEEALANLKEALELHFEPPQATRPPKVRTIEVEVEVEAAQAAALSRNQAPARSGGIR
jgi:hypothetical protein